jgi:hypothetical protein
MTSEVDTSTMVIIQNANESVYLLNETVTEVIAHQNQTLNQSSSVVMMDESMADLDESVGGVHIVDMDESSMINTT